jgi:hypothetical protein
MTFANITQGRVSFSNDEHSFYHHCDVQTDIVLMIDIFVYCTK